MRVPSAWPAVALVALVVLAPVNNVPASAAEPSQEPPPLAVLFLGNSYTYCNDLPGMLAALAETAGTRKIETAQHTPGAYRFEQHFLDGKAVQMIAKRKWDAVVLQEQSLLPVLNPQLMHEYARKLHAEIAKQGARTVFFLTWARQNKPQMQQALNDAYFAIAKELKAEVAPVGVAWQRALAAEPKLDLYAKDGSHPSVQGTYLAACVFYATLLNKSPVGLPAEVRKDGKVVANLDPELARRLQAIAWETVK